MKGIPMRTWEVRAILDNHKTVTRRVVKPQHLRVFDSPYRKAHPETPDKVLLKRLCEPPYRPGDILYVREAWCKTDCFGLQDGYIYKENDNSILENTGFTPKWRPSIHMPREAARLFLRVTDVRVEKLQTIEEEQAVKEGCSAGRIEVTGDPWGVEDDPEEWTAVGHFRDVWNSTIRPKDRALYGWEANPWVWVIEFERCEKPEGD